MQPLCGLSLEWSKPKHLVHIALNNPTHKGMTQTTISIEEDNGSILSKLSVRFHHQ